MACRPLLLGHRGSRVSPAVPENTLASFDLSLEHGCDGFEFDVRRAACGTAVICHDAKVGRLTVASTQAKRLPKLPMSMNVLQRYAQRALLNIELKVEKQKPKTLTP